MSGCSPWRTAMPLLQTALSVPASVARRPTRDYSSGGAAGEVKVEKRSLLAKLLSGDFEPHQYSASASSIPIRQLATFPFIVTSLDVVTQPKDRIPRLAVTDGRRVFQYRLENQTLTAEWTYEPADGRQHPERPARRPQRRRRPRRGGQPSGREDRHAVLHPDHAERQARRARRGHSLHPRGRRRQGRGRAANLWGQAYSEEKFYGKGGAKRYTLDEKGKDIVAAGPAPVNEQFRALGVTFSNIAGKDQRVMAFVDERSRLVIAQGAVQMWRSLTPVGGGGLAKAHLRENVFNTHVDKFFDHRAASGGRRPRRRRHRRDRGAGQSGRGRAHGRRVQGARAASACRSSTRASRAW